MRKLGKREKVLKVIWIIIFIIFSIKLAMLQIVKGEEYRVRSNSVQERTEVVTADRGIIYDRNDNILAYNKSIKSVVLNIENSNEITQDMIKELNNLHENLQGVEYIKSEFPVKLDGEGKLYFTYDYDIAKYLVGREEFEGLYTAREVFDKACDIYIRYDNLSDAQKQDILISEGIYLPISITSMMFTQELEKQRFLDLFGEFAIDIKAEEFYNRLCEMYEYDKANIKDNLQLFNLIRLIKVKSASGSEYAVYIEEIPEEKVIKIMEEKYEYPSFDVVVNQKRTYPYGATAAHVIGYLGNISSEEEVQKFLDKDGYNYNSIIGKTGIEKSYEDTLHGNDGYIKYSVNAYNEILPKSIVKEDANPGESVSLSIDIDLQVKVEEILENTITKIRKGGTITSPFGDYYIANTYPAKSASVVITDVNTNEILALANYPDYNPNLFIGGITSDEWNDLQPKNYKDPLAPRPLFNVATQTAVQPGSVYKMVTAITALDFGLDPYRTFYDGMFIEIGGKTYGSWLYNKTGKSHGDIDMITALEESVNYYFYNLSMDNDFYQDKKIGLGMGIKDVLETSKKFGFDKKTGIEIEEANNGVPDEETKKLLISDSLYKYLHTVKDKYFEKDVLKSDQKIEELINDIISYADKDITRNELVEEFLEKPIINDKVEEFVDIVKYSYYQQMGFNIDDSFNLAIGQGMNAYTPVQIARYLNVIANDGKINELTLIKDGNKNNQFEVSYDNLYNIRIIQKAMEKVAKGEKGSASGLFGNYPIDIAAKTGTAQKFGKVPTIDESNYIKNNLHLIDSNVTLEELIIKEKEIYENRKIYLDSLKEEERIGLIKENYLDNDVITLLALNELSQKEINQSDIDKLKRNYSNFAWFVSYAPAKEPDIAITVMITEGGEGTYAGAIARKIYDYYFEFEEE